MRAVIHREVEVAAPAGVVWDYVTDWARQGEWIPMTRVEAVGSAQGVGGRVRAWTGLGPIGFWDSMTITAWQEPTDGPGRCEVMHTGAVVKGAGEFAVVAHGEDRCTFVWWERLAVPAGPFGAVAWRIVGPLVRTGFGVVLRRMAARVEGLHAAG